MKYWWVNQKQTFRHEIGGGYMWSPKKNKNGARNQFYENMTHVSPGDMIFSYYNGGIGHIGTATSSAFEERVPTEFGSAGAQWKPDGWRVNVQYKPLSTPFQPKDHMEVIAPLLPEKYSPIQPNGDGNQVYLAEVPEKMARALIELIGKEVDELLKENKTDTDSALEREKQEVEIQKHFLEDNSITETERKALVSSRVGQGKFREKVSEIEKKCRVTGVKNPAHLIASHIKPWRFSTNQERLDGHNGLLLAPHIDHLFDRGFISFSDEGEILISPQSDLEALSALGIDHTKNVSVGTFTSQQQSYLGYHRNNIFKS
jgi:hypothetical protein